MKRLMKDTLLALMTAMTLTSQAFAADTAKTVDEKVSKWKDGFLNHCQNQADKSGAKNSKEYCVCIVAKHRDYLVGKIKADEDINIDEHLKELTKVYRDGASQDSDDDTPSIVDLDIDLAQSCLAKNKKTRAARSTPSPKK